MLDYTCRPSGGGYEEAVSMPRPPLRTPYAMAFVQPQCWENTLCAEDALNCGSAFRSLVMPFFGKEASKC